MRDLSDGSRIQAKLLDDLLAFSARYRENREVMVRSPSASVAEIPYWRVTFLWFVGGVVGFVEDEGFDRPL